MLMLKLILASVFLLGHFSQLRAQNPDVPHGGGACASDWDCSLGGECVNRVCACDPWFTGETCAFLNLAPAEPDYGMQLPSFFSWGGRALQDDKSGQYHGFFSFMCRHATLDSWTTKSASVRAVSSTPVGPFTYASMIIQPWSHNTVIVRNPPDGKYLLYHIGNGVVDPREWAPCYNGSDLDEAKPAPLLLGPPAAQAGQGEAFIQYADSIEGPYTAYNNNTGIFVNWTGSWTKSIAGNPAPFIFPNGTVLLYFTATPCPAGSGALVPNCIAVARADSWDGVYQMMGATHPITYPESEDPSVFQDPRGNFHLLTNINTYHARCAAGVQCGGHAWSRDGLTFSNLTVGAFGPVIRFSNGSYWSNAYIERPFVTQDEHGVPIAFYGGLGRREYSDSCSWAQYFCKEGQQGCGPTFPPPPPPPVRLVNSNTGKCLVSNDTFPCSGTEGRAGCPVFIGDCSSPSAEWIIDGTSISSARFPGKVLDVDCMACAEQTLVKLLVSSPASLAYSKDGGGQIEFTSCSGLCLNAGQGLPNPPCGPAGEQYLATQIKLEKCSSPNTMGWSLQPVV